MGNSILSTISYYSPPSPSFISFHSSTTRRYGWLRDLPDRRDVWMKWPLTMKNESSADLRDKFMPNVYDQGELGSCTANAIVGAFCYQHNKEYRRPQYHCTVYLLMLLVHLDQN